MKLWLVAQPKEQMTLAGDLVGATVPLQGVRWDREAVLIVDLGEKRTGGYAVEVVRVAPRRAGELEAVLRVTQPKPGAFVAQVLTHPYAVARVPRAYLQPGEMTLIARDEAGHELARQVVQV